MFVTVFVCDSTYVCGCDCAYLSVCAHILLWLCKCLCVYSTVWCTSRSMCLCYVIVSASELWLCACVATVGLYGPVYCSVCAGVFVSVCMGLYVCVCVCVIQLCPCCDCVLVCMCQYIALSALLSVCLCVCVMCVCMSRYICFFHVVVSVRVCGVAVRVGLYIYCSVCVNM